MICLDFELKKVLIGQGADLTVADKVKVFFKMFYFSLKKHLFDV